jgi:hypothetical protein
MVFAADSATWVLLLLFVAQSMATQGAARVLQRGRCCREMPGLLLQVLGQLLSTPVVTHLDLAVVVGA